jgi:hypothetical protein
LAVRLDLRGESLGLARAVGSRLAVACGCIGEGEVDEHSGACAVEVGGEAWEGVGELIDGIGLAEFF